MAMVLFVLLVGVTIAQHRYFRRRISYDSPSRTISNTAVYLGLAVGAVITLVPFGLGLLTSFTSARQFNTESPLSLPAPPTLANYTGLADAGFGRALVVTALMTAVILLGQLVFSVLAAYAFARLEFPAVTRCSGCTSRR